MTEERVGDRRSPPLWMPYVMMVGMLVGLLVSACACVLGPMFGAVVAIGGTYVRGAVMEQRLTSIESKVDKLVESNEKRLPTDGKLEVTLSDHTQKIGILEARATKQENQYAEILGALNAGGKKK